MSASPDQAELLSRVEHTDVAGLRAAVRTLRRVAGEYDRVTGQLNGVRAAASNYWRAGSQKSFDSYATRLTGDLSDAAAAMRAMAGQLDGHAEVAEAAQRRLLAAAGLATAGKYASDQTADDSTEQRWALQATTDFHASEQRVRTRLWALGSDAPGAIPLPTVPPQPQQSWWQAELFPSAFGAQQWLDRRGVVRPGNPRRYDPKHPLFGFDEDGDRVPAYEADPMAQQQIQAGIPLRGIFEVLGLDAGSAASEEEATALLMRTIKASDGFRDGHINRHIREFYKLPGVGEKNPPPPPKWAKDEFLRMLSRSGTASNRVFKYTLKSGVRGQPRNTFAYLSTDPNTQQMIAVQFYADGDALGDFATAFRPTASQLKKMLEAETITK